MTDSKLPITPRALLEARNPSAPHIDPDGKRVVFVVTEADFDESRLVSRLWMADIPDGNARQITFSYEGERAPRWSPDGRHIAFLSTRPDMTEPPPPPEDEEDEAQKEQVWVMRADGGEAHRLTRAKEGVIGFHWLPDSSAIIYLCPEKRAETMQAVRDDLKKRKVDPTVEHKEKLRRQFWEVGLEQKEAVLLYTGDFGIAEFDVAPDGTRIVFNSNGTGEANDYYQFDLFVLTLDSGESRKVLDRSGGKFHPAWSPKGDRIAFLANLDPNLSYSQECVWSISPDGGTPVNLFSDRPWDAHSIAWQRNGSKLFALVADRTNGAIVQIRGEKSRIITPQDKPVECTALDVGVNGQIAAVLESSGELPELAWIPSGATDDFRILTELNAQFHQRYQIPQQELVTWRSADGLEVEGLLVHPPDSQQRHDLTTSRPLIVQIHGGPKGHCTQTLRGYYMHSVWAAEGYLVFRPNFRGSEGYGNEFAIANRRDLGGGDFQDVMTGIDMLIERGIVDPERIGIMGGSYGGYMTNWAISQTERFKAAISGFGVFNLITDYSNSEIARWDPDYMGAYYWEDPDIYRKCSPSSFVDKINTPVLIIHGADDNNTFIANSREMYRALKDRGAVVEFVHYPREGHGLREPNHRLDEMRRCLAWFDKYIQPDSAVARLGDRVEHDGYEMIVSRAEDGQYLNWDEGSGRILEVAVSIASLDPVDSGYDVSLTEMRLTGADAAVMPMRGIPVDGGGGKTLVEGEHLIILAEPDRDTGRIRLGIAAAYDIPHEGGRFTLKVEDFPPVSIDVGIKEKEAEETAESGAPAPYPPLTMPGEEAPIVTPER